MMNKKMAVIASLLISTNMLSGCAKTPGTPVVRPKGEHAMEHYKEADEAVKTQSTVSDTFPLYLFPDHGHIFVNLLFPIAYHIVYTLTEHR